MNCQLYKAVENNSSNNSNIFSRICNWTVTPKCMLSPWVWTLNLRITTKKTVIIHYIGIYRTHFAWKKEPHKCLLLNLKQLESIFQPHNPRWILESWRPLQIAKGLLEGTKFRSSLGTCAHAVPALAVPEWLFLLTRRSPKTSRFLFFGLSPVAESERYSNRKMPSGTLELLQYQASCAFFFQDDLEHSSVKLNKTGGNVIQYRTMFLAELFNLNIAIG